MRVAFARIIRYKVDINNQRSHDMRSATIFAVFALSLLPATAFAQAPQQAAAETSSTSAASAPSSSGSLTREQFIERAEQRAARRAAAQFDRMDTDHNGVLDPAEMRAWRSQHSRGAGSRSDQSPPQ
jgi:phage terminase small subunit